MSIRLANMLSAIKNNAMVQKTVVEVPYAKLCESVANVMKDGGFVSEVKVFKEKNTSHKTLKIELATQLNSQKPVLTDLRIMSKPGRRIYKQVDELKKVVGGYGIGVISTSRGIMSVEDAKRKRLGGELLCEIW